MTRMWLVSPIVFCTSHLSGEHNELHKLVGSIFNHPHGDAIAKGHVEKRNIDTTLIEQRHAVLAAEMDRRGWDHDSPLSYDGPTYGEGIISPADNLQELAERCDDCRERIASTPVGRWL